MSKGARKREIREEKIRMQMQAEEQKKIKNKKNLKLSAIAAVCLVLASIITIVSCNIYGKYLDSGEGLRNTVAFSSENYAVDNAMMSYYIYDTY